MKIENDLLLRVLNKQPVERTPFWMMRQAGRYLPEYKKVRAQAGSFMNLCRDPQLACEVTLQPLQRFNIDAAILFSDILTIPDAMGLQLDFIEGKGPIFNKKINSVHDIKSLPTIDVSDKLFYVFNAIKTISAQLNGKVPLIGFSGSPWTLATYMIEGAGSRDFAKAKAFAYEQPQAMHDLLGKLSQVVSDYLLAQIAAGVQVIMIFDTWGGVLPHWAYRLFSLQYIENILENINKKHSAQPVASIIFSKGCGQQLSAMRNSNASCVALDWTTSLATARQVLGDDIALQGNLDPAILRSSAATIEREVARVLADYGHGNGHIFNLGHGITPDIDPEKVNVLIDAVAKLSRAYH